MLLLLTGLGLTEPAEAQTLGYSIASDQLVELDLETGAFSTVGTVGTVRISGLAMAADGFLYGVSYFTHDLWRIDPSTADSTLIGPLGMAIVVDTGLTFDACGTLWMITNRRLYEVDPGTGGATLVSNFAEGIRGLTARGEQLLALVRVDSGNQLASIDPLAGSLSLFGDVLFLPTLQQGLDFDNQGVLWGIFWNDSPIPFPRSISSIVSYDPQTGQILSIRELGLAEVQLVIGGNLAITPPQGVCRAFTLDVPTSSSTSLLVLALLLGSAGLILSRRLQVSR